MPTLLSRTLVSCAGLFAAIAAATHHSNGHADTIDVKMPSLTLAAQAGHVTFEKYCSSCHGGSGGGTDKGPPLIHRIYEPSHHGDISFVRAAKFGTRAHHWRFGNMPPVQGIGDDELLDVILFVREVQRANGIR